MTQEEQWMAAAWLYVKWFGLSVIPLGKDKRPMIKWKEFQTRVPTYDELTEWPKWNIAIATGAQSNLAVIDCESKEDAEWFWKSRGKSPVCVKTRRGFHLYFRHPGERVLNATRVPDEEGRPRYDVRGDGGYVLAPPSTWQKDEVKGRYEWTRMMMPTASLPEFDLAWGPERKSHQSVDTPAIRNVEAYIAKIFAVSGKSGHSKTWKVVNYLKESRVSEAEASMLLSRWNSTNADPPWDVKDLLYKLGQVYR